MIGAYLPSLDSLVGLVATLAVAAAFLGVGSLLAPRTERAEDLFVAGYGAVLVVVTTIATAAPVPLWWFAVLLVATGALGLAWAGRSGGLGLGDVGRAMMLMLPLLLIMAGAHASQWDEFSNWLPKHRYLLEFDSFPRIGLPPSTSALAAYPDGLPLIGYFVGRLARHFVENAGALFNTLLAVVAGLLVARLIAAGANGNRKRERLTWGHIAAGLLAVTALNPTFVPKVVFTAYLDWTTAVVLAVLAVTGWRTIEALAADDEPAARQSALLGGLAMAAFVDLKQTNLVLAVLVLLGMGLAVLRVPGRPLRAALRLMPIVVIPAAMIYIAWRLYVRANIPGGEFTFLPLEQWLWSYWLDIALRMAKIAASKGGYFALMLVLAAVAARALVRPSGPFGRLAIITATVFVGYNAFLYVTYIGAFGADEGPRAASYWRYNTQLGVLGVAAAAYGLALLWRRWSDRPAARALASRWAAAVAVALVLAVPVATAGRLRFDINPAREFVRGIVPEIAAQVPQGRQLLVVDRNDNGMWTLVVRYEIGRRATVRGLSGSTVADSQKLHEALAAAPSGTYVWVHVPEASVEAALGVPLAPHASHLLAPAGDGWTLVKSWPWPGYDDPHRYDK